MNKYKLRHSRVSPATIENTVLSWRRNEKIYVGCTKILRRHRVESLMNPSRDVHARGCLNEGNPISMRGQWNRSRKARISSGPVSLSCSATCILSVPSCEICACFVGPMKCVNLISRCCGRINMHRAAILPRALIYARLRIYWSGDGFRWPRTVSGFDIVRMKGRRRHKRTVENFNR